MKRNFSLIVLGFEIIAIVVLHALKMSQQQNSEVLLNNSISKENTIKSEIKQYPLLSIK